MGYRSLMALAIYKTREDTETASRSRPRQRLQLPPFTGEPAFPRVSLVYKRDSASRSKSSPAGTHNTPVPVSHFTTPTLQPSSMISHLSRYPSKQPLHTSNLVCIFGHANTRHYNPLVLSPQCKPHQAQACRPPHAPEND